MATYKLTQKTDANGTTADMVISADCIEKDTTVTSGSSKPVTSGAVYNVLADYVDKTSTQSISGTKTFDDIIIAKNKYLKGTYTNNNSYNILGVNASNEISLGNTNAELTIYAYSMMKPSIDNSKNLGNSSSRWKDLYISGGIKNGTLSWTMPSSNGTLALTSDIPSTIEGTSVKSTGVSADKVLFSDGDGGVSWEKIDIGYINTEDGSAGQVLTADGSGGASWTTPSGGGSATDVQINGTSITSGGVANILTQTAYNSSTNKIATMTDLGSYIPLAGSSAITGSLAPSTDGGAKLGSRTNATTYNRWSAVWANNINAANDGGTNTPNVNIYLTDDVYTTAPASVRAAQYLARDKNGDYIGGMRVHHTTAGLIQAQLFARHQNTSYAAWVGYETNADATSAGQGGKARFIPSVNGSIDLGAYAVGWRMLYLGRTASSWEGITIRNGIYNSTTPANSTGYRRGDTPSGSSYYLGTYKTADNESEWMTSIASGVNTATQTYISMDARQATTSGGSTYNQCGIQVRAGNTNGAGYRYIQCTGNVFPVANATYNLGLPNYKWANIYCSGTIYGAINGQYIANVDAKTGVLALGLADGTYLLVPNTYNTSVYLSLIDTSTTKIASSSPIAIRVDTNSVWYSYYTTNPASPTSTSIAKTNAYLYACKVYKL